MDRLDEIDDELADAEDELDELRDKIKYLDSRKPGIRMQIDAATSPEEKSRLELLLQKTEEKIGDLRRQEQLGEARADELGREFREEQKLKLKKPKPKM